MVTLISLDAIKQDLRLGDYSLEDEVLERMIAAAARRCEGYIGRRLGDDGRLADDPLAGTTSDGDMASFNRAVSLLVGVMFRDRDEGGDLPRQVAWQLEDLRTSCD